MCRGSLKVCQFIRKINDNECFCSCILRFVHKSLTIFKDRTLIVYKPSKLFALKLFFCSLNICILAQGISIDGKHKVFLKGKLFFSGIKVWFPGLFPWIENTITSLLSSKTLITRQMRTWALSSPWGYSPKPTMVTQSVIYYVKKPTFNSWSLSCVDNLRGKE